MSFVACSLRLSVVRQQASLVASALSRQHGASISTNAHGWSVERSSCVGAVQARLSSSLASSSVQPTPEAPSPSTAWQTIRSAISDMKDGAVQLYRDVGQMRKLTSQSRKLNWAETQFVDITRTNLKSLVPFAILTLLPGSFVIIPLAVSLHPTIVPTVFQPRKMKLEQRVANALRREHTAEDVLQQLKAACWNQVAFETQPDSVHDALKLFYGLRLNRDLSDHSKLPTLEQVTSTAYLEEYAELRDEFQRAAHCGRLTTSQCKTVAEFDGVRTYPLFSLRSRLNARAEAIHNDDILLAEYGVQNITRVQLIAACEARGIPTLDVSEADLRQMLNAWLQLSAAETKPRQPLYHACYAALLTVIALHG
ncbi:hypothetical protein CAOG_02600 [Capsaspora owczarzaki ATCC 30864]|uniref:Letm1 RBD domain-containing protein n=1 Tax=Capsaspora owczarzaki (strain ATCC 30864) TaxID=595528 RepID=A0A0D2X1V5_CAPO3|nr:hypothetical protein CAOG_02600 [Capsaspora owczarzaki ATCC 30864]KJE91469.1 hypothetical protein CAOG_002600 [Capsaspora owczarzaki ATCC 30864]|eukprot:XP_004349350.1 hypothetical protein CAOG_02600 [Capsaspora owczarzaki ATCC 30864]